MKKPTKGLFYVESPFQLLCAIEAKNQFKLDYNYLFIRINNSKVNNEQTKEILKTETGFTNIRFLNISNGCLILTYIYSIFLSLKIYFQTTLFLWVILGPKYCSCYEHYLIRIGFIYWMTG
jgi:hypothetical protein